MPRAFTHCFRPQHTTEPIYPHRAALSTQALTAHGGNLHDMEEGLRALFALTAYVRA